MDITTDQLKEQFKIVAESYGTAKRRLADAETQLEIARSDFKEAEKILWATNSVVIRHFQKASGVPELNTDEV